MKIGEEKSPIRACSGLSPVRQCSCRAYHDKAPSQKCEGALLLLLLLYNKVQISSLLYRSNIILYRSNAFALTGKAFTIDFFAKSFWGELQVD